jgi:hypothetical protein
MQNFPKSHGSHRFPECGRAHSHSRKSVAVGNSDVCSKLFLVVEQQTCIARHVISLQWLLPHVCVSFRHDDAFLVVQDIAQSNDPLDGLSCHN